MLANLKALRTAQGLSQRALADFVKVSQQSINQYENAIPSRTLPF